MPVEFRVTPECCADVLEYHTVFLRFEFADFRDGSYDEHFPHWVIEGRTADQQPAVVQVHQCPHCHAQLPGVKVREDHRRPICRPKPDLSGCWTCKLLLSQCRCLPPEYLYEPDVEDVPLWRD